MSTGRNSQGEPVYGLTVSQTNPQDISKFASNPDNVKAYGIYADGSYVYFTEDTEPTVEIAKTSDLTDVGCFNLKNIKGPGSVYAVGIAGSPGSIGYAVVDTTLYSFDISSLKGFDHGKCISQDLLDSVTILGNGKKIIVTGANAYVVTDSTSSQLQIIPLLSGGKFDKNNIKSINMGNNQPGVDLAIDLLGRYAYVITDYSSGNDLFIVDLSNTNNIYGRTTHRGAEQDMNPRGVAAVALDKIVVVGCNGDNGNDKCQVQSPTGLNYQVFNVPTNPSDPSNISFCGGMIPASTEGGALPSINTIAGVTQPNGDAFAYIIDGVNSSAKFQIIAGGAGGGGGNIGTFESSIFDCRQVSPGNPIPCTSPVIFNSFAEIPPPPMPAGVTTFYQVAVSMDCTTFNYTGSYGPSGGQIPLNINPGYCFRYKVTFANAGGATEASTTVGVNYSP